MAFQIYTGIFKATSKLVAVSFAFGRRVLLMSISYSSFSSISIISSSTKAVPVNKLQYCEEEFDKETREAKFAFRSNDLGSWKSPSRTGGSQTTNSDPTIIQHWALVVHFPGGKTYLFEAWCDENTGRLQPGCGEIKFEDFQVFQSATYFGTTRTSAYELYTKAKQVNTGRYGTMHNNCQTWMKEFLRLIDPELLTLLYKKVPATKLA